MIHPGRGSYPNDSPREGELTVMQYHHKIHVVNSITLHSYFVTCYITVVLCYYFERSFGLCLYIHVCTYKCLAFGLTRR